MIANPPGRFRIVLHLDVYFQAAHMYQSPQQVHPGYTHRPHGSTNCCRFKSCASLLACRIVSAPAPCEKARSFIIRVVPHALSLGCCSCSNLRSYSQRKPPNSLFWCILAYRSRARSLKIHLIRNARTFLLGELRAKQPSTKSIWKSNPKPLSCRCRTR